MMEQIWAFLETQHVSHSNYSSDLSHRCHDHWSWEKPLKSTCCIAKSSILYMSTSFPTMVGGCWWLQNHRVHIVSKKLRLPGFSNSNICFFPQTRPTARCWCVAVITAKIEIGWGLRIAKSQKNPWWTLFSSTSSQVSEFLPWHLCEIWALHSNDTVSWYATAPCSGDHP